MNHADFAAMGGGLVGIGLAGQNAAMQPSVPETRPRFPLFAVLIGFALIATLLQLLLILNPGYFSHDELQWAALAQATPRMPLPWDGWLGWRTFQYRPLTFDFWLLLLRLLFRTPIAFHAVWVSLGVGNAVLLLRLMRRLGIATGPAVLFAFGFVLGPFAAFTHGWVATLADLLWVGFGLILAQVLLWAGNNPARRWPACALAFVLTTLALLSKESAIVLPALIVLAWLLAGRPRLLRDAAICSALPVLLYLALRLDVILFAPRAAGIYDWSLWSIPRQWLLYQLFPLMPSLSEINSMLTMSYRHLWFSGLFWLALTMLVFRAHARAGWLLLLGGGIALGPVLLLEMPSDQYGYGFSAITMLALAWAWPRLGRAGRSLAVLFVLIGIWHGVNVQRELHHDGQLQARFSPALAQAVAAASRTPIRLRLPQDHPWVYQRLTHEIPSYDGVAIGDRVRLVGEGEAADYVIEKDGGLTVP
jgi:hypothetical protein